MTDGALAVGDRRAEPKERITMRLDVDLLEWFRQQGRGHQTRMDAIVGAYHETHKDPCC